MKVHIYTDSSKAPNNNFVGISIVVVDYKRHKEMYTKSFVVKNITNNRGELLAIYFAILLSLKHKHLWKKVCIFSDSLYCVNSINGKYKIRYHKDLFNLITSLLKENPYIKIRWIKGHSGNKWNDLADELANQVRINFKER